MEAHKRDNVREKKPKLAKKKILRKPKKSLFGLETKEGVSLELCETTHNSTPSPYSQDNSQNKASFTLALRKPSYLEIDILNDS
mmetsp:Transcript_6623/g.5923  ORF Transcript_6623/g.5923 Transcript_6623/m.5923 type:complete len:84 (-) Transcript_6623:43-294(-)